LSEAFSVVPSLWREATYSSIRIGFYEPIKQALSPKDQIGDVGIARKVAAGVLSGTLGSGFVNPTDLVKMRLQAIMPYESPRPYSGSVDAVAKIVKEDGLAGLYRVRLLAAV
jgi:solute carrier family 25 (mitochondrial oxoglutarate transporter), member 11